MERYFKLRIPFATKSYIRNRNKGLYILGNAFFIYDREKNIFIDEYIQIIKGNYRITDLALIKPTDHYENPLFKNFRDKYLDKYSKQKAEEIFFITHKNLTNEQIKEINNVFKNMNTTVKNMFSCLSGSNISGSETNKKASPMRCIDNEYWDCNFANVIKHFMAKPKEKRKLDDWKFQTYKLKEIIEKNYIPNFRKKFFEYNDDLEFRESIQIEDIIENNINDYEIQDLKEGFKLKENQENFIYSIINKTIDDYNEFITSGKLKNKLRSFFYSNIKFLINTKRIPLHSTVKKGNLFQYDNAHIIPFAKSVNKLTYNDLYDAINPYNCLRIDKNIHHGFDKREIHFDLNGNIIGKNKKIILANYLDIKNMPNQTMEYFKRYIKSTK